MTSTTLLPGAIIFITAALVFYTIGTWAEKIQGRLRVWHIVFFLSGLLADATGTRIMAIISEGKPQNLFHQMTGMLALILMAIHALWAVYTYVKGNPTALRKFSRYSVIVWAFWLIPYFIGVVMGMNH